MAKEQDQSMEEILQSIKRIIAEEGEPAPSGSDVLELTELLSEEDQAASAGANNGPAVGSLSIEEIMAAPIEPEKAEEAPAAAPAPAAKPEPEPAPTPAPAPAPAPVIETPPTVAATPASAPLAAEEAPLISDKAAADAAAALDALKNIPHAPLPPMPASGMHFRSGQTIEDLVLEALRPMLKEWLDEHLAKMVERLVEKEVRRISSTR